MKVSKYICPTASVQLGPTLSHANFPSATFLLLFAIDIRHIVYFHRDFCQDIIETSKHDRACCLKETK